MKIKQIYILFMVVLSLGSCKKDEGVNFFSVNQDAEFGEQFHAEILNNPSDYPLLSESSYPAAYTHLRRVRDAIVATGELVYADRFPYNVYIIHDDNVVNAFAAPGGYLYFYTGLIKFLDDEAEFAGVMAHEIAHADKRHSTEMLTQKYGFSILVSVVLGNNPSKMAEIAAALALGLSDLRYSRKNETESDTYAVKYLSKTTYDPRGIIGFFEKMDGSNRPPEFLSTHPNAENRIENIQSIWVNEGSKTGERYVDRYQQFKSSLP
jgi:beta-barrel assembly-enhancing protease